MLPYVRIIAVHIIPSVFKASNNSRLPIDRPQLALSFSRISDEEHPILNVDAKDAEFLRRIC